MQVSTRISYQDPGLTRLRRPWTGEPVPRVKADERGGGYRGTLARGSHQQVNERTSGGSADKEIFFARSLTSTLAMLQMNVMPDSDTPDAQATSSGDPASVDTSFVDKLFSGVLAPRNAQ